MSITTVLSSTTVLTASNKETTLRRVESGMEPEYGLSDIGNRMEQWIVTAERPLSVGAIVPERVAESDHPVEHASFCSFESVEWEMHYLLCRGVAL